MTDRERALVEAARAWVPPKHSNDCEAMKRPRADCTCVPVYPKHQEQKR